MTDYMIIDLEMLGVKARPHMSHEGINYLHMSGMTKICTL